MIAKIFIVVGTRPNFIKITQFQAAFSRYKGFFEYKLVHTGQHFDKNMSHIFFRELELKKPDFYLETYGVSPSELIDTIIIKLSYLFTEWNPDLVIVVGDVNSTLAASIACNKCKIRLAHLESGLRSFDREMPEEINRIITDSLANDFFISEQSGFDNLFEERGRKDDLYYVGNTMIDTLVAFEDRIEESKVLYTLGIEKRKYILMTLHRPSNIDSEIKLIELIKILEYLSSKYKVVFPLHPRTRKSLEDKNLLKQMEKNIGVMLIPPLGYLDYQKLISNSMIVITDSGGTQEETTFKGIPCLTLRENTERPITITLGTNELVNFDVNSISKKVLDIESGKYKKGSIPPLWDGHSTERIVEIIYNFFLD